MKKERHSEYPRQRKHRPWAGTDSSAATDVIEQASALAISEMANAAIESVERPDVTLWPLVRPAPRGDRTSYHSAQHCSDPTCDRTRGEREMLGIHVSSGGRCQASDHVGEETHAHGHSQAAGESAPGKTRLLLLHVVDLFPPDQSRRRRIVKLWVATQIGTQTCQASWTDCSGKSLELPEDAAHANQLTGLDPRARTIDARRHGRVGGGWER